MRKWKSVEDCLTNISSLSAGNRKIKYIILHHTWSPSIGTWNGDKTADAILKYWLQRQRKEHWKQPPGGHFIIAPNGYIYCPFKDLSLALNSNSNNKINKFGISIEAVGNFDNKVDQLVSIQKHTVIGLIAGLCVKYALKEDKVYFHRDFTDTKSCPGTGIDREKVRKSVEYALSWAKIIMQDDNE